MGVKIIMILVFIFTALSFIVGFSFIVVGLDDTVCAIAFAIGATLMLLSTTIYLAHSLIVFVKKSVRKK